MKTDAKLTNGKHHSNDLSANTNLKDRFKDICRTKNGFELDNELVQIAKEWQLSLQDCRFLWENYCQSLSRPSPLQKWWQANWKKMASFSGMLATISHFSIAIGMIAFIISAENREDKTTEDTWKLINDVSKKATNSGRIDALKSLNRGCYLNYKPWKIINNIPLIRGFFPDCIDLVGIDISNAHLDRLDLQNGELSQAIFNNTKLKDANFSGANLQSSKFNRATLNRAIFNNKTNLESAEFVGASLINAELKDTILYKADFDYADLQGADLRGANLIDADISTANLKRAIFDSSTEPSNPGFHKWLEEKGAYLIDCEKNKDTNLEKADLAGINLSDTNLSNANLIGANLRDANLNRAILNNTNLAQANLRGANLNGVIYNSKTTFIHAIYDDVTVQSFPSNWLLLERLRRAKAYKIEANAKLNHAFLYNANLRKADLSHAKLNKAWLIRVDLRGADLRFADLEGAILTDNIYDITTKLPNKLSKSYEAFKNRAYYIDALSVLNKANLAKQNLEGANLAWAKLKNANLKETNLNGAKLEGAKLIDANLQYADLTKADLNQADLTGADLTGADLTKADLHLADLTKAKVTPEQVKSANNWETAKYDPEFAKQLGLPTSAR